MGTAELAVLLQFQTVLHGPLVLGRRVVPLFTVCTGQGYDISHEYTPCIHGAHDQD